MSETGFTLAQALAAQRALRGALGLGEERFPLPAFIGMLSDEIEQLRAADRSDREIAQMIGVATGQVVDAESLGRFYASPEARAR